MATRLFLTIPLIANPVSDNAIDNLKVGMVTGGVNTAVNKQDPQEILKQGALGIVANTIGSYGASQIGANFDGNLSAQTAAHFLSSGTAGWILDQSSKGFISAGMGAVVAKLMMSSMQTSALEEERQINNKANGEEKLLSIEERKLNLKNILEKHIAISQITSASVAAMAGYDPDLAAHMGGSTARNNCEPTTMALFATYLMTSTYASMVYYDVMDVFNREGAWAALERLSWEGAIYTATLGLGEIVKVGEKAIKIAGKVYHNPVEAWNVVKGQIGKLGKVAKGEKLRSQSKNIINKDFFENAKYTDNPEGDKGKHDDKDKKFENIKGTAAKKCKADGSIWEKNKGHGHGDKDGERQWKRWSDEKSWDRRDKYESVWQDGRVRENK